MQAAENLAGTSYSLELRAWSLELCPLPYLDRSFSANPSVHTTKP